MRTSATPHESRPSPSAPGAARDGRRARPWPLTGPRPTRGTGSRAARPSRRAALPDRRHRRARARGRASASTRRSSPRGPAAARPSTSCSSRARSRQDALARAIAERHGLDHLDLTVLTSTWRRPTSSPRRPPSATRPCPVQFIGDRGLLVAMADPANVLAVDDIALMTGYEVRVAVASREDIAALIARLTAPGRRRRSRPASELSRGGRAAPRSSSCSSSAEDAPVIKLVNRIVAQAVEQGASDIHFDARRPRAARALPHRRRAAWTRPPCRGAWSPASSRA